MRISSAIHDMLFRPLPIEKWKPNWWLFCIALVAVLFFFAFPGSPEFIFGTLAIGGFIAWRMALQRKDYFPPDIRARDAALPGPREAMPLFGPNMQILRPTIGGNWFGVVLVIGLALVLLRARLVLFAYFLLGMILMGVLIGTVLWWKHR